MHCDTIPRCVGLLLLYPRDAQVGGCIRNRNNLRRSRGTIRSVSYGIATTRGRGIQAQTDVSGWSFPWIWITMVVIVVLGYQYKKLLSLLVCTQPNSDHRHWNGALQRCNFGSATVRSSSAVPTTANPAAAATTGSRNMTAAL
jgi:hypothetical protein